MVLTITDVNITDLLFQQPDQLQDCKLAAEYLAGIQHQLTVNGSQDRWGADGVEPNNAVNADVSPLAISASTAATHSSLFSSMKQIIVRLDVILATRKMRSKKLAERIGITETNLSLLRTGKIKGVRFDTLAKICAELDCTPGDLLDIADTE